MSRVSPFGLFVMGEPKPKGSPKVVTHGRGGKPLPKPLVLKDSRKTERWERAVAEAALVAIAGGPMFEGVPLELFVTFGIERPKSHFGKRGLLPSAPIAPQVKPDTEKLVRSLLDPLEGIVFDNDSRIVRQHPAKIYVQPGEPPGAYLSLRIVAENDVTWLENCYSAALEHHRRQLAQKQAAVVGKERIDGNADRDRESQRAPSRSHETATGARDRERFSGASREAR